ncbi:guanine nucleotide exchange protein smcr8a [Paramormyrops kingsleyae]|uniref:Smith-Magenis syndrome chromosome region, candidate 8a n=1 Tax=Paramormyrops kingsleyae TaxID=1676925 RepID=A0A3B3TBL6_9TELE|nr:guanine nucleotide exchange protein smcr8a-like [Paramormyrops kingsleyae]
MIGSPDLVAFTKDDAFGQTYVDPWSIPEEFSVPLYMHDGKANPWSKANCAKFSKDFILISEFSEQVGPQPLLTIPDDPKVFGTFDLNYFSLRIMSVDYQASFVGHLPGCGYPKINFVEDSKVVLGDSKEGAFAYVHHLTLYDLEARGFVRPFCMAYISSDERKIMQQLQELSSEFSKASESLKAGNRKAFADELEKKLKDLEYTRAVLHKEAERQKMNDGCYSTQAIEKANELANVEKSFYEHKDLLKQVTSYPNRRTRSFDFLLSESDTPADLTDVDHMLDGVSPDPGVENRGGECKLSYTPQLIKAKPAKCFDKRLKTLEELCDMYFFHQTMDQLRLIEDTFRGDLCYIYNRQIDEFLLKKQKTSNFLFEEKDDWQEEEVAKEFCGGNRISDNTLPPSISDLSCKPQTLETCVSSEESLLINREPETGVEGLLDTESSLCDLTQENSDESTCAEIKGSLSSADSGETNKDQFDVQTCVVESKSFTNQQPPCLEVQNCRTNGEKPFDEISPVDFVAAPTRSSHPGNASLEDGVDAVNKAILSAQDPDPNYGNIHETEPFAHEDASCCMRQEGLLDIDPLPHTASESCVEDVVKQEPPSCLQGDPGRPMNFTPNGGTLLEGPTAGLSLDLNTDEASRRNADDASDTISCLSISTSSDRAPSPFPHGGPVTVKQKRKAGLGALKFIRQYPFAQQAIFSLLSGRTLVVLGVDEATVRKLVNALTIFVPNLGKYGERVQPWLTTSFQLADLLNWKLIGLQRISSPTGSSMLHSLNRYSRYISVLDADHKTLRCPPYRGSLVARLADHRTQIKRGCTYYTHVQSVLTELTSKAFLYTFCYHLHLPISPAEDPDTVALRRAEFLHHHFCYSKEDSRIVQFLSELIKDRYLHGPDKEVGPPVFCFNYVSSLTFRI